MATWNQSETIKIAFFLDNSFVRDMDFSNVLLENPGCGGTEFEFYKIATILERKSSKIAPILLLKHPTQDAFCPCNYVCCHDAESAYQWAEFHGCRAIVFRGFFNPPKDSKRTVKVFCWMHNGATAGAYKKHDLMTKPDGYIFVSKPQFLSFCHPVRKKSFICHNALSGPSVVRSGPNIKKTVAYIGNPAPSLHFDKVLLQFAKAKKKNADLKLYAFGIDGTVFGSDPSNDYEYKTRRSMYNLGLSEEDVIFKGKIPTSQLDAELRDVLVGVVSPGGAGETFCLSATDLLRNGIPVIVPNAGAFIEVVPKSAGFRVFRLDSMASIIHKCYSKPGLAEKKGTNGRKYVAAAFADDKVLLEWEELLTGGITRVPRKLHCQLFRISNYVRLLFRRALNAKYKLREY